MQMRRRSHVTFPRLLLGRFRASTITDISDMSRPAQRQSLTHRIHYFWLFLARFLPIIQWLPQYRWRDSFFADVSAGLTMAVFSIPTGGFAILSLMTRSAIEKIYRVTQHAQLLLQHATTQNASIINCGISTSAITQLAIGGLLLTNGTMDSNDTGTMSENASAQIELPAFTDFNMSFEVNPTFENTSESEMAMRILAGGHPTSYKIPFLNVTSDSMVFGLTNDENGETIISEKVEREVKKSSEKDEIFNKFSFKKTKIPGKKPNPFLEDTIEFTIADTTVPPDGRSLSETVDHLTPPQSDSINSVAIANFDDNENLTMVIVQENGADKAAAIFVNALGGGIAPSTAALVAAASKAAVAALPRDGSFQKKSIDAQSIAIAGSSPPAAPNDSNKTPIIIPDLKPIQIATVIVFTSSILQILMGVLRVDFLSCYLSEQIMSGFVVGGYVHVFFSLIGDVLGLTLPQRSGRGYLYYRALDLLEHWRDAHLPTSIISACSMGFLLFSQQILEPWLASVFRFPIPYELILVIVGITATNFAKLSKRHSITVVGHVPTNFPMPSVPRFELISFIFFDAVSIAITAVAIHLTVAKIVENRYRCKIDSCQELYSLGLSGLLASLFPVFPVTSVFARTLIGEANQNCTQMTIFFSSMALLAVILYVGPALEYLPKCILASIIIVSLGASFSKFREIRQLWPLFKFDFLIFVVSFLLTVCYGMAEGLTFTIIFAIFTIVVRDQWPKWHFLSHDEKSNDFREMPKESMRELDGSGACVLRYDAPLIFPNVHKFLKVVEHGVKQWEKRQLIQQRSDCGSEREEFGEINTDSLKSNSSMESALSNDPNDTLDIGLTMAAVAESVQCTLRRAADASSRHYRPTILILDCSGFPYVDYLGLCTLKRVYQDFIDRGVVVKFAAPKAILMRMFCDTDFMQVVPPENIFATVRHAVDSTNEPAD